QRARVPERPLDPQRPAPTRLRPLGVVHAELLAENVADLADRAPGAKGVAYRRQEVPVSLCDFANARACAGRLVGVALGAQARRPLELPLLGGRVERMQLDG